MAEMENLKCQHSAPEDKFRSGRGRVDRGRGLVLVAVQSGTEVPEVSPRPLQLLVPQNVAMRLLGISLDGLDLFLYLVE